MFVDKNGKKMTQKQVDKAIDTAIFAACKGNQKEIKSFASAIQRAEAKRIENGGQPL